MSNNLTLSVTLTGDGRQLSGTLRNARGEVQAFGGTTEREGGRAERALDRTGRQAQTVSGHLNQMRNVALGVGGALAAMGVASFVSDTYDAVSSSQQLQASLKTVTGSIENASAAWDTLLGFAAETPFTLDQSVQAFIRMQSLGLNPSLDALRSYGNTASAMGKDMMQMVEAVADATTGEFERLKEFGIRSSKEGEQISFTFQGVTTTVANSAAAISQYLQNIGENQFAGAMADQMDTLSGKASNLEDTIYQFYLAVGDAGATDVFEGTLANASNTVQFLTNNIDTLASGADVIAVLLSARVAVALATATTAMLKKTLATQADAKAEAIAAQQTVRRTAAELQSANAIRARAVADAKATAGTNAHAFAMQNLTAASARATAAQAAHTSATNVATAAMGRASVMARGLSGGLALIGGPLGAAMLAGGAIYYFREELGLTEPKVTSTEEFVRDLSAGIDTMSAASLNNRLDVLRLDLAETSKQAITTAISLSKLEETEVMYGQGMSADRSAGIEQRSAQLEELRNEIDATTQTIAQAEARRQELIDSRKQHTVTTDDNTGSTNTNTGSIKANAAAIDVAAAASKDYSTELDTLRKRLQPGYEDAQRFAKGMSTVTIGLAAGKIGLQDYTRLVGLLQEELHGTKDVTNDLADNTVKAAYTMEGAWDEVRLNGLRRLDDGFASLWENAIDGSLNAGELMKKALAQTLAEMAHMAMTRPVTVQLASSMGLNGNASGGAGGQSMGGFSDITQQASSLYTSATKLPGIGNAISSAGSALGFGSGAGAAASAGGLYGSVATGAAQGGLYGTAATGGVAASGGLMSTVGSAMPWIGGAMLADNVLGLGITEGITKAISGLFGGSPTKFSGRFGTNESGRGFEHQGREDSEGQFYQQSAFGTVGFMDQGTKRLQRAGQGDNKEWAEQLAAGAAQMDNLVASLAQSEAELGSMTAAVQGLETSSGNAADIIEFALNERPRAAINAMSGQFGQFVQSLTGDIEQVVQQANVAHQAYTLLTDGMARLNLQFDASSQGAYAAAGGLAEKVGGVQRLDELTSSYYQTFFTEAERATHLQDDLTQSLAAMGLELPETRQGFRDLIEAQQINTQAGRENVAQLLQLHGSFDQLQKMLGDTGAAVNDTSAVLQERAQLERELLRAQGDTAALRELELSEIDKNNRGLKQQVWAIKDAEAAEQERARAQAERQRELDRQAQESARAAEEAARAYQQAVNAAEQAVQSAKQQVQQAYQRFDQQQFDLQLGYLDLLGDSEAMLAMQRERELQTIDASLRPFQERLWALQDETKAQQQAREASRNYVSELERVRGELSGAMGNINGWIDQQNATGGTPEMNLASAQEQLARQLVLAENGDRSALQGITQYADRVLQANDAYNASSSAGQRVEQDVFAALKDLPKALSDAEYIVEGFRGIVSNEMAKEIERAIFKSQYTIDTLIDFAADAAALPADLRTILGEQTHRLDSTLNYLLGENELDTELRQLALASSNNLVATVDYIARRQLSNSNKRLALSSSNTISAIVDYVVGSELDRDSKRLALESSNAYGAMVNMILGRDITPDDRTLALDSTNNYTSLVDYVVRAKLTGGNRRLALSSGQSYEALIGYYVDRDVSQADRELALTSGNRYLTNVEYIVGRDISSANRRLALNSNNRYVSTINQLIGKKITGGDRRLALGSTNAYLTTVDAVLKRGIPSNVRTFGLANSNAIMTTVDGILASGISGDVRTLALKSSNQFVTTLEAALKDGRLTGDERKLLNAKSANVVKTLKTSGGLSLKPDEWAVINAASGTQRLQLLADVAFGRTDLDELGAIKKNTEDGGKSIGQRAREQTDALRDVSRDMTRQLRTMNALPPAMNSLKGAIGSLRQVMATRASESSMRNAVNATNSRGNATIGKLRAVESKANSSAISNRSIADFFDRAGNPGWGLRVSMSHHQNVAAVRSFGWHTAKQMRQEFGAHGTGIGVSLARSHQPDGLRAIAGVFANTMGRNRPDGSHFNGLPRVPFDGYLAELHENEAVLTATQADTLRDLASGGASRALPVITRDAKTAPIPSYPLLSKSDVAELLRDLKREVAELRRDNARLQSESNKHLAAANNQRGAAAKGQIGAIERGNKMLKKLEDDKRLEAAKR